MSFRKIDFIISQFSLKNKIPTTMPNKNRYFTGKIITHPQEKNQGLLISYGHYIVYISDLILRPGDIVSFELQTREVKNTVVTSAHNLNILQHSKSPAPEDDTQILRLEESLFESIDFIHKTGHVSDIDPVGMPSVFEHYNRELTLYILSVKFTLKIYIPSYTVGSSTSLSMGEEVHFHLQLFRLINGYPVTSHIDNEGHPLLLS